jgi:hypothetical protein
MSWIAAGIAVVGAGVKIYSGIKQNKLAKQMHPTTNAETDNPYLKAQLGTVQQLFNAPIPGMQNQMRGIQASQSNTNSYIQRNATDSAQALSLGELNQGITNNAVTNLGGQEAQYKMGLLGNLSNAYGAAYGSVLDKYKTESAQQQGLRSAGMQNIYGGINDVSSAYSSGTQYQDTQKYNQQYLDYLKSKNK